MPKHSPTPWKFQHDHYGYEVKDADGSRVMSSTSLDVPCQHIPPVVTEVPRIVRRVNLHDELVAALRASRGAVDDCMVSENDDAGQLLRIIDALLAKAKGEA